MRIIFIILILSCSKDFRTAPTLIAKGSDSVELTEKEKNLIKAI